MITDETIGSCAWYYYQAKGCATSTFLIVFIYLVVPGGLKVFSPNIWRQFLREKGLLCIILTYAIEFIFSAEEYPKKNWRGILWMRTLMKVEAVPAFWRVSNGTDKVLIIFSNNIVIIFVLKTTENFCWERSRLGLTVLAIN